MSIFFLRVVDRIPGQSGCEPGAANPCGNLWEGSVAVHDNSHRRLEVLMGECSRLLMIVWLCLIAWMGKKGQHSCEFQQFNVFHWGYLYIPLCLLAINVGSGGRCSEVVEISEDETRQIRQRVFVPYNRYVPRGDMPCRAPKIRMRITCSA